METLLLVLVAGVVGGLIVVWPLLLFLLIEKIKDVRNERRFNQ